MAQKVGELIAVDGSEVTDEDMLIVHPATIVAVDGKPTQHGKSWHIPVAYFKPGRMGMPVLSGKDTLILHDKPVVKVVYDDELLKAAGLETD